MNPVERLGLKQTDYTAAVQGPMVTGSYNQKSPRGLLDTADQLQSTLQRINHTADNLRGALFGFGPSCDECEVSPTSLDDILNRALRLAEEAEKTLIGIGQRITND